MPPPSESKIDPAAFELSYWETIKNSTNADDFKAYLEKYPSGQFASLAKNRINSLDAPAKPVESRAAPANDSATELAFWDSVKNSNKAADYRRLLSRSIPMEISRPSPRDFPPDHSRSLQQSAAGGSDNHANRSQSNPRGSASGDLSPHRAFADARISPHPI